MENHLKNLHFEILLPKNSFNTAMQGYSINLELWAEKLIIWHTVVHAFV